MIGTHTIRRHWPTMLTPLTTREWIEEVYSRHPHRPDERPTIAPIAASSPGRREEPHDLTWADGYADWIEAHAAQYERTPPP